VTACGSYLPVEQALSINATIRRPGTVLMVIKHGGLIKIITFFVKVKGFLRPMAPAL
jgi:hypothetical protein